MGLGLVVVVVLVLGLVLGLGLRLGLVLVLVLVNRPDSRWFRMCARFKPLGLGGDAGGAPAVKLLARHLRGSPWAPPRVCRGERTSASFLGPSLG